MTKFQKSKQKDPVSHIDAHFKIHSDTVLHSMSKKSEYLMKDVLSEVADFKIGGRIINNVR